MNRIRSRSILNLVSLRTAAFLVTSALAVPTSAAIDQKMRPTNMGRTAGDVDEWQRIPLRSKPYPSRGTSQIKVAIQTRGTSLQGLIRIPGAPASNFDTGHGFTLVDLINAGNETNGYSEIVALEILFTQRTLGQSYEAYVVDWGDRAK